MIDVRLAVSMLLFLVAGGAMGAEVMAPFLTGSRIESVWPAGWLLAWWLISMGSLCTLTHWLDRSGREAQAARVADLERSLRDTAAVAIHMLYESHKADVLRVFTVEDLEQVVTIGEPLQGKQVEDVYREAWKIAMAKKEFGNE